MDTPAVVSLVATLGQQLQHQAQAAAKLQSTCTSLGSFAARLGELVASIGAQAAASTPAEWQSSQPRINERIQRLSHELKHLVDSDSEVAGGGEGDEPGSERALGPGDKAASLAGVGEYGHTCPSCNTPVMKRIESRRRPSVRPMEPPDCLLCPISRQLMTDPLLLVESGHTYQGALIRTWLFRKNGRRDPLTNQTLLKWPPLLVRNHVVHKAVHDFIEKHPDVAENFIEPSAPPSTPSTSSTPDARLTPLAAGPSSSSHPHPQPAAPSSSTPTPAAPAAAAAAASTSGAAAAGSGSSSLDAAAAAAVSTSTAAASGAAAAAAAAGSTAVYAGSPSGSDDGSDAATAAAAEPAAHDLAVGRAFAGLLLQRCTFFVPNVEINREWGSLSASSAPRRAANHPLHWAIEMGWVALVQGLLERGAPVNARDENGEAPLHLALKLGAVDVLRVLLMFGADADLLARDGKTPLHLALENDEAVEVLLRAGADAGRLSLGITPIFFACKQGSVRVVQLMLENGASPFDETRDGKTPLHVAATRGMPSMVGLLLDLGAVVDAMAANQDIAYYFVGGMATVMKNSVTPLHFAAFGGHVEAAELLLLKGASVNAQTSFGETPLYLAARRGSLPMVRLLLQHGADKTIRNREGRTPHKAAIAYGNSVQLEALLR